MQSAGLRAVVAILLISGAEVFCDEFSWEVPEPPPGFANQELKLQGDVVEAGFLIEEFRLNAICHAMKKSGQDPNISDAFSIQIKRMLLSDDATRTYIMNWYFSRHGTNKSAGLFVSRIFASIITEAIQLRERAWLNSKDISFPEGVSVDLLNQQFEFALYLFYVLRPYRMTIGDIEGDFLSYAKDKSSFEQAKNDGFGARSMEFLLRFVRTNRVKKYIAIRASLRPGCTAALRSMATYFEGIDDKDCAKLYKQCAEINAEITAGGFGFDFTSVYAQILVDRRGSAGVVDELNEILVLDKSKSLEVYTKAVRILSDLRDRNQDEEAKLIRYKEIIEGRRGIGMNKNLVSTPPFHHKYFGF
ncbi:MAG: hypothetical protein M5U26_16205 [Planctomycetota bacterium]|nr:hypothetical protein [Planctomycetota bacterium]